MDGCERCCCQEYWWCCQYFLPGAGLRVLGKPRGLKLAASTGSKHVNARDTVQCCNARGATLSGVGSGVEHMQVLIDAVVHAVNKDYEGMAGDFVNLGFLASGTDVAPIVPALENIWADSLGQSLGDFNFRTVTSKFNKLVFQYPIRIPERYSLVIRSLLTQEGICMTLDPSFHFLEVAYPYVAKRLLTDDDLRERLFQVPCFASLLLLLLVYSPPCGLTCRNGAGNITPHMLKRHQRLTLELMPCCCCHPHFRHSMDLLCLAHASSCAFQ
jgi:hypothetical protein